MSYQPPSPGNADAGRADETISDETTSTYSPQPVERPRWTAQQGWSQPAGQTPQHWFEPGYRYNAPQMEPVDGTGRRRRAAGAGSLVLVSLLSAVAAAGSTAYLLRGNDSAAPPTGAPP